MELNQAYMQYFVDNGIALQIYTYKQHRIPPFEASQGMSSTSENEWARIDILSQQGHFSVIVSGRDIRSLQNQQPQQNNEVQEEKPKEITQMPKELPNKPTTETSESIKPLIKKELINYLKSRLADAREHTNTF